MEDNCFTILCWFLPYINMNQPQVYICALPLEPSSHLSPPSHPSRLSQNTGLSSLYHTANSHWLSILHIVVVQLLSCVPLFANPLVAAQPGFPVLHYLQQSLLRLMFIESVMHSNHLILCQPLPLLPSLFPSIRVFSNESALCIVTKVLELQLQHQSFQ